MQRPLHTCGVLTPETKYAKGSAKAASPLAGALEMLRENPDPTTGRRQWLGRHCLNVIALAFVLAPAQHSQSD
jgi:hypothetical protein